MQILITLLSTFNVQFEPYIHLKEKKNWNLNHDLWIENIVETPPKTERNLRFIGIWGSTVFRGGSQYFKHQISIREELASNAYIALWLKSWFLNTQCIIHLRLKISTRFCSGWNVMTHSIYLTLCSLLRSHSCPGYWISRLSLEPHPAAQPAFSHELY